MFHTLTSYRLQEMKLHSGTEAPRRSWLPCNCRQAPRHPGVVARSCRPEGHTAVAAQHSGVQHSASPADQSLAGTAPYQPQDKQPQQQPQLAHQMCRWKEHQTQQQQQKANSSRRRQLLAGGSTLLLSSLSPMLLPPTGGLPAAVAARAAGAGSGTCQLQDSPVGLQWCDIVAGDGQLPIKGAFTKLNYTAKLASSGTVFDSTYQRRQPFVFKVGEHEMIEAFDVAVLGAEGIPPMREGGKRLVVAPPGPLQRQGVKSLTWVTGLLGALEEAGESVSPDGSFNSVLEFEIELVAKRRTRG